MIIKDIQLTNFGKFNHKTLSLEPGLNIVYGENEAGKTTLHTFIRGMLFGIDKQRGKASGKDLYTKYEPWENPSNYQGTMRVENDGVSYRFERNFNKDNKLFRVINEDIGKELSDDEIEELFSGIDEGCYYNTISISQLGSVTDKELEVILKNYAANLGSTKSMEIDIKAAFENLDNQRRKIASENKIGEEEIVVKSIKNLAEQLELSEAEQHTIIFSIQQKKEVLSNLENRKRELSALDAKRLEELAKQNERKDNLYQEIMASNADIEKYTSALERIQEQKAELEKKFSDKGIDGPGTIEWIMNKTIKKSNIPIVFLICMMACIGAAIGFGVGNFELLHLKQYWIRPALCLAGAALFLVLALIKYLLNKKRRTKKLCVLKELKLEMDKLEAAKHEEVYIQRQLNSKREALENAQEIIKAEEERHFDTEEYSEEIKELEKKEREVNEEISKAKWVLEQKKEKDIEIERRIEELNERFEKIENAKVEIAAIETAKTNIEEIASEIRNSFGKKLNEQASYYMSKITNGKYDNLVIDDKLNISINSKKSLISASKLSKGTIEQIYMSLRLAAADIIFEKDKKPILLDDAFVMYDNKRMGNTIKFMAGNMNQVILFSCHTREKVMADKLGLEYNFIRL